MKCHLVQKALSDKAASELAGTLLGASAYDVLVQESAAVRDVDGQLMLKYIQGAITEDLCLAAYSGLRNAAVLTENRGMAAGVIPSAIGAIADVGRIGSRSRTRFRVAKKDGTLSNTTRAIVVHSGIVGYFDRSARAPYCRQTAYTAQQAAKYERALPFFQAASRLFAEHVPERYAVQAEVVSVTSPAFVIPGTVFTTVTVNRNWQTAVHRDAGDLESGYGVMAVLDVGQYGGCYLCFPQYRFAVDMRRGGVCLADVHQWHGNTPFVRKRGRYERLSLVLYYRERMMECGSPAEELQRAKHRKRGDRL